MLNRKADGGLTAIIIIIVIIVFLGWLINLGGRECNSNKECNEDSYCGSDFNCHEYPNVKTEVTKVSITLPILIISITLIILALIWRWENIFGKVKIGKKKDKTNPEETTKENPEAYYSSQVKYTAK